MRILGEMLWFIFVCEYGMFVDYRKFFSVGELFCGSRYMNDIL